jgi:hypothetical protein
MTFPTLGCQVRQSARTKDFGIIRVSQKAQDRSRRALAGSHQRNS